VASKWASAVPQAPAPITEITRKDEGVAGLHRLLDQQTILHKARVVIVVAGMDGVLPSVVGGLVDKPIVAVPTSQGYGASFGGLAALLTMLKCLGPLTNVMNGKRKSQNNERGNDIRLRRGSDVLR